MKISNDLKLEKSYCVTTRTSEYNYTEIINLDDNDLKELVVWIKLNKPGLLTGEQG